MFNGAAIFNFAYSGFVVLTFLIKMSIPLLMLAVIFTHCEGLPAKACNRLKIANQYFDIHILWTNLGRPYNLNVHRTTNSLFFSYSVPETYSDLDFQLSQLNIDTKEYTSIPGIKGGCATAIDHVNEDIYLGGSDGIYKYNMATKLADIYKEKDKNIWSLFFKRNLFYVSYPDQKLFMEIDGNFAVVKEFQNFEVDQFYTTHDDSVYFANSTGFYRYNMTKFRAEMIHDLITVRQITEDNMGRLYACTNFGLYVIIKGKMEKVLNLKNIYGIAFDKDNNFVLSDDKRIIKLLQSNESCLKNEHW